MAMKLQIKAVEAPGKIEEERLVIKALADTDIGAYVLLQAGFNTEQKVLNVATYHAFWFPYQEIKSGDLILIYSKKGLDSIRETSDGTTHLYFKGFERPIWDKPDRAPVLLYAPDWEHKDPDSYLAPLPN